jgi:hypothetical protein
MPECEPEDVLELAGAKAVAARDARVIHGCDFLLGKVVGVHGARDAGRTRGVTVGLGVVPTGMQAHNG